jgi:hypothetical protein
MVFFDMIYQYLIFAAEFLRIHKYNPDKYQITNDYKYN